MECSTAAHAERELRRPSGFGDELRAVLAGPTGTWGTLTLLREAGRPDFTTAEVGFVATVTSALADGLRRTALHDELNGDADASTGFLIVDADDVVELANDAARRWMDELHGDSDPAAVLPVAVRAVIAQTRRAGSAGASVATARVRTRAGQWVIVRGSLAAEDRVAVLIETARPAELATAIADTYGFTERERAVTAQVARGLSTAEIAEQLHLSAYTVQDHLKAIFDKSGTNTRGALVARLFLDHHLPLLTAGPPDAQARPAGGP